jgi:predicted RNA polymerase sigma factor
MNCVFLPIAHWTTGSGDELMDPCDQLVRFDPSPIVRLNRTIAVALGRRGGGR